MGDLTDNFSRYEFKCHHCAREGVDLQLVIKLQILRDTINRPIIVTSGYRCHDHPIEAAKYYEDPKRTPGGHELGFAADIRGLDILFEDFVYAVQTSNLFTGIGVDRERHFVHVDIKNREAAWTYHKGKPVYA